MAKKSALGKGLESLMGEASHETGALAPDTTLDIKKIKPNKDQPRKTFNPEELEDLTQSIKQHGILQPLLVRPKNGSYEIVAGERRYQAAKRAGLKEVPVVIKEIDDSQVFTLALIENLQRSDLSPIEEARGYKLLIEQQQLTQEALSALVSKSRSAIANTMRLLDLPLEVQDYLLDGKITAGHARALLMVPTDEGRMALAEKIILENLTVRATEHLAPLFSVNREEQPKKEPTPQSFKRAARRLRLALDTNVKVKQVRGKNKIEIEFGSEEDLARILDIVTMGE